MTDGVDCLEFALNEGKGNSSVSLTIKTRDIVHSEEEYDRTMKGRL